MPTSIATYRKLLLVLAAVFAGTLFVVLVALSASGSYGTSIAGLLFVPFLAPAVGSAFVIQAWARPRLQELGVSVGLGALVALIHALATRVAGAPSSIGLHILFGLGFASLTIAAVNAARAKSDARAEWLSILLPGAVVPAFVLVSNFFLGMTALLHPMVRDASVHAADALFDHQPSFVVARIFQSTPPLAILCRFVYWNLPLALAFVFGARRRSDTGGSDDVLFSFIALGLFAFALYHLFPVVGPAFFFRDFPNDAPELTDATRAHFVSTPVPRNCMPSLHTAWALLLYWQARPLTRFIRWGAGAWLVLTELGTLGFGFHYAMDLVVAFPFALVVRGLFATSWRGSKSRRGYVIAAGAVATVGWFALLLFFAPATGGDNVWRWSFAALTVVASFFAERGLDFAKPRLERSESASIATVAVRRPVFALTFTAGAAAGAWQVALAKSIATACGSLAQATATMLVVGMAGIAVGSAFGGEIAVRSGNALRIVATCLVLTAIVWMPAPWLLSAFPSIVPTVSVVVLPSAILAGIAVPSMIQGSAFRAARLVSSAMAGMGFGAWLAGYLVIPFLGLAAAAWVPILANLCAGLMALRMATKSDAARVEARATQEPIASPPPSAIPRRTTVLAHVALATLSAAGITTIDVHLLSAVASSNAYSVALLGSIVALGIAVGAALSRHAISARHSALYGVALVELVLAIAVLIAAHGWSAIPGYFASFAGYAPTATFGSRELVRFALGSVVLAPAAFSIGALAAMHTDESPHGSALGARALGRATALAMVSAIVGAALASLCIERVGSLPSFLVFAGVLVLLGTSACRLLPSRMRWHVVAGAAIAVALFLVHPRTIDYHAVAGGAHVHFRPTAPGRSIDHAEDLKDGITSVTESNTPSGERVLTLFSNGKLQSNGASERGVLATYALYPLVHTAARDRALIIGLGSGATAQIVQRATSGQVDVVEGSMNIIHLARAHFAASSMPHIEVIHSEVRRFFALNTTEYDLLFIGPSPIWLPDGTHVYHREFYRHAKARLRPRGVFEQGLPLDQLRADDLVAVLATIRVEFPRIWLYATGAEGALVACNHDCAPTPATTQSLPDARQLLSDRLLSPDEVDKLLADVNARGVDLERLVSTDDNALLEFAATRRVAGDDERTFKNNLTLLRSFMPSSIFAGTRLSEKDLRAPRLERSPPESDEPRSLGPLAPDDGVGR